MMQDKRESVRISMSSPVRYQRKGSQGFDNCITKDFSDSGIGFISNEFFPLSTHLVFEIEHPEDRKYIKAVGEVVWISSQPHSDRFSVGARFIGPPITL